MKTSFLIIIILILSCYSKKDVALDSKIFPTVSAHQLTDLPIMLEMLTEEQRAIITSLNDQDSSSYLINSRPVLFQIQGVEDDQDQVRYTQDINEAVQILIYAFAEYDGSKLVDYGWIETETGALIWEMDLHKAQSGGGDIKNLKFVDTITLPPGDYRLRYISNDEHSTKGWIGQAPERPFYYGITAYNLKAIEFIKTHFKE